VGAHNRDSQRRPGAIFDDKLAQFRMIGETAVAAVAKIRADLVNVTSGDFGTAQSAMRLYARSAIVDQYEAEHIGPSTGNPLLRNKKARLHRHPLLMRLISMDAYSLIAIE